MTAKKHQALGRGFDSLFPTNFDKSLLDTDAERVRHILITDVFPNPQQPRKTFIQAELEELAASIKQHGILQPLIVTERPDGGFEIVAGERRFRAAKLNGLEKVPVLVRTHDELSKLEIAITENVQRVDLNPMEEAESLGLLHDQFSLSVEELAKRLGKATTTVVNQLRLRQLPMPAREALRDGLLTEGHARAILGLKDDPDAQARLLDLCLNQHWSVRQAEQFVQAQKQSPASVPKIDKSKQKYEQLATSYGKKIGAPIKIKPMQRGGQLIVRFQSEAELKKLLGKFD